MRKKGSRMKHTSRSVPMILHREGEMLAHEVTQEMAALLASRFGVMQIKHFDKLVEITNIARVADELKPGSAKHFQIELEVMLRSMLARYNKHKSIGVNAHERARIPALLALNDIYWKGQTTTFYNQCAAEVNAFYKEKDMMQPLSELEAA